MRYLILSDIHANLDALQAVLHEADRLTYDRVLVLGDLVGYGAQPSIRSPSSAATTTRSRQASKGPTGSIRLPSRRPSGPTRR
jgi:Icc-related predicted phosphoesterase